MRSPFVPFAIAAAITILIGIGVSMEPYFAGDVAVTRALQSAAPNPEWWATPISRLAPAPNRYWVMAIALVASVFVGGWRGLALVVVFLLVENYGADSTKLIFKRPRPSPDLIAVVGKPTGFTFPSTTITFFAVTFGALGILAAIRKQAPYRMPVMAAGFGMLLLGCVARVALGAHWPSDVLLTSIICLAWIWAASRVVLGKG